MTTAAESPKPVRVTVDRAPDLHHQLRSGPSRAAPRWADVVRSLAGQMLADDVLAEQIRSAVTRTSVAGDLREMQIRKHDADDPNLNDDGQANCDRTLTVSLSSRNLARSTWRST